MYYPLRNLTQNECESQENKAWFTGAWKLKIRANKNVQFNKMFNCALRIDAYKGASMLEKWGKSCYIDLCNPVYLKI